MPIATAELNLRPAAAPAVSPRDFNYARKLWAWFLAPPPSLLPDEWAEREIRFDYSKEMTGPCNFAGRNYLRRPIRDSVDPAVRKQTKVFGRGNGKTLCDEVQMCYDFKFMPGTRGLGVYPATEGEGGSKNFATTRLRKTIKASPAMRDLLPKGGQERLFMNGKKITIGGSHYGFIGSNSGSQGVSNRLTRIYFDEMEKFAPTLKNEAGIDKLAEGSVEGVADYQIHYSSTPTIEEGLIWNAIQKSNLHLYFLPCPHCSSLAKTQNQKPQTPDPRPQTLTESERAALAVAEKFQGWFILLFSEQYAAGWPTKLPDGTAIPFARVQFRYAAGGSAENPLNDARNRDGTWDFARVQENAHLVCPHCKNPIRDFGPSPITPDPRPQTRDARRQTPDPRPQTPDPRSKIWMDAHGAWICVQPGEPGHIGYMINSLYASVINKESTFGGRSVAFLTALAEGGEAMRTFINAILAGVFTHQQSDGEKVQMNSQPLAQPDWIPVLTADFHKNHPYLWFIVRKWCAFKLLPPVAITDGQPEFIAELDLPGNEAVKNTCAELVGNVPAAWLAVGELARFNSADPATGRSPLIDFLLAQNITGAKLVKFFRETAGGDTLEFRRQILLAMFRQAGGDEKQFRAARGGDSELIAAGYCDRSGEYAWDELTEIITEFKIGQGLRIPARAVAVDCGFAENKNRIVLQKCHESATQFDYYDPTVKTKEPFFSDRELNYSQVHGWDGWQAIRGKPTFQPQGAGLGRDLGRHVEDPYFGTPKGGTAVVDILEIPTALFWLRKHDIRQQRTRQIATISPVVSFFPKRYLPDGTRSEESNYRLEDYQKQSNMMIFDDQKNVVRPKYGVGGAQSKRHPDHPDDCETYQVALATHLEFFETGTNNQGHK